MNAADDHGACKLHDESYVFPFGPITGNFCHFGTGGLGPRHACTYVVHAMRVGTSVRQILGGQCVPLSREAVTTD